ncbi:hypothetical protein BDN70DRAFT_884904 [Pholiota conissans]|uniref:Lysine-specific metallo-endopeptidase domain-containing protein n=1 Tax=Pholiota conissans TaxID=109636 RepID=A0A9P6CPU3_9AGAR|nr:hypothetical protein BDN70DRAFT_884904 [Pholiota conissans]
MLHFTSKFLLVLAVVRVAVGVPLGIEYDKTTGLSAQEQANKVRLDQAAVDAHAQVGKMREGFNKYKNGEAKATALFHAAFGQNADVNVVDSTISQLENGNIRAKLDTHPFTGGEIAAIPWTKDGKKPWTAGDAQFSAQFHGVGANALNNAGRAGTLIHEATHQLSKTGDDVNKSNNIARPYDGRSQAVNTGYTSNHNMHKTVAEVTADTAYTNVRDNVGNMHINAESYAVFGSLCSQPGALRRRDLHLFNRALFEGDDDQLVYLARRNSCQLPPDYFAKKAAAKKAAAAKAGTTPGHDAKSASAKTGANHAKAGHLAPVGAKGGHIAKTGAAGAAHVKAGRLTKAGAAAHVKGSRIAKVGGTRAKVGRLAKTTSKVASKGAARHAGRISRASKVSSPKARGGVKARPHVAGKVVKGTRGAKSSISRAKAGTRPSKAGIRSSKAAIRSSKTGTRSPKLKTAVKGAHATAKAAHGAHLTPSRSRTPLVKGTKTVHQVKATRPKGQSPRIGKAAPARQPKNQAHVPKPVVQPKVASRVTKPPVKRH